MAQLSNEKIKEEALTLVKTEKDSWEQWPVYVTDKVIFDMREMIRFLRKNYWGVFDHPIDPLTGKEKIWPPLTETLVESVVKNIDLDTKDINFRAKKLESIGLSSLVRNIVRNELDEIYFGETLDELERQLAIDGTVIWKTLEKKEEGKIRADIRIVDLLNFYIDPTVRSIQEAESCIERAVMSIDEFKEMAGKDWVEVDEVKGNTNVNRHDGEIGTLSNATYATGNTKMVEVYERWGKIRKKLITGNDEDKELIEGRVVCSVDGGKWRVHLVEKNKKGIKPYEECWYTRVANRWHGKGIAEKVMFLQLWLNVVINTRITRAMVSQLGIFKIRKGSGITPKTLSRLAANGAIQVNDLNDIEQFVMQEASQSSFNDEENIVSWGQRLTSAFEAVTGEQLPASTSATSAAIQSRSGQSQFVLIKKGIGMFLQRWMKRHYIPMVMKNINKKDIVRVTGEFNELQELDERYVNFLIFKELKKANKEKRKIDPEWVQRQREKALEKLQKMGTDRYVELLKSPDLTEFDVQVYVTNEEIDKGVLLNNLQSVLGVVSQTQPQLVEPIFKQMIDVMGLDINQMSFKSNNIVAPPQQTEQTNQTAEQLVTQANTLNEQAG